MAEENKTGNVDKQSTASGNIVTIDGNEAAAYVAHKAQ